MSAIISHWKRNFKATLASSHHIQAFFQPQRIEQRCREFKHRWRRSFWSPSTTLLTCVLQSLNPAKSLRAAVADLLAHVDMTDAHAGQAPSADPSAFAQARQRVPIELFQAMLEESACCALESG